MGRVKTHITRNFTIPLAGCGIDILEGLHLKVDVTTRKNGHTFAICHGNMMRGWFTQPQKELIKAHHRTIITTLTRNLPQVLKEEGLTERLLPIEATPESPRPQQGILNLPPPENKIAQARSEVVSEEKATPQIFLSCAPLPPLNEDCPPSPVLAQTQRTRPSHFRWLPVGKKVSLMLPDRTEAVQAYIQFNKDYFDSFIRVVPPGLPYNVSTLPALEQILHHNGYTYSRGAEDPETTILVLQRVIEELLCEKGAARE